MTKKSPLRLPSGLIPLRTELPRSRTLLTAIGSAIETLECRRIDQKTIAAYAGLPEATYSNWCNGGTQLTQIEALLSWMERLANDYGLAFFGSFLREYPQLASSRLAHDPFAVGKLHSLLQVRSGLTFISAENDTPRTYLITALGHAASRVGSTMIPLVGLDTHGTDVYVPVPGLIYLSNPLSREVIQEQVEANWHLFENGPIVLLNGIWSAAPKRRSAIARLASSSHVLIADQLDIGELETIVSGMRLPARLLEVSQSTDGRLLIRWTQLAVKA